MTLPAYTDTRHPGAAAAGVVPGPRGRAAHRQPGAVRTALLPRGPGMIEEFQGKIEKLLRTGEKRVFRML